MNIPDLSSHLSISQIASMHSLTPQITPGFGMNISCDIASNAATMAIQQSLTNAINLASQTAFSAVTPDSIVQTQIADHNNAVSHVEKITADLFNNEVAPLVKQPESRSIMQKLETAIVDSEWNKAVLKFFEINTPCHEECMDELIKQPPSHLSLNRKIGPIKDVLDLINFKYCKKFCDKHDSTK